MKSIILLTFIFVLSSCASLSFDKSTSFTLTGVADPGKDKEIVKEFKELYFNEKEVTGVSKVKIYINSTPDGFSFKNKKLTPLEVGGKVIGKANFRNPIFASDKAAVITSAKKFVMAAGGDAAMIFYLKDYDRPNRILGFEGFVVKSGSKQKQSKNL